MDSELRRAERILTRIEARIPTLARKSDLEELKAYIIGGLIGGCVLGTGLAIAVVWMVGSGW